MRAEPLAKAEKGETPEPFGFGRFFALTRVPGGPGQMSFLLSDRVSGRTYFYFYF
jgi:hypothetical protein